MTEQNLHLVLNARCNLDHCEEAGVDEAYHLSRCVRFEVLLGGYRQVNGLSRVFPFP